MSHGHDHSHVGDPAAPGHRRRIAIALGVTATILVAQAVGALLTGSLALLTDTAHMLTDAGGLAVALVAAATLSAVSGQTPVTPAEVLASVLHRLGLEIGTLPAGGTMNPRSVDHTYFDMDGQGLQQAFLELGPAPVLDLLEEVRPNVVSCALDPEASGPDTHYKVLQAISEAANQYVDKNAGASLRV